MDAVRPLRGACSCGRNHYVVLIPADASNEDAKVFFDDSVEHRRTQAAPLTAWLRVPLPWYRSTTTSYFPDESHGEIRRTYTPQHEPHSKRTFCSFCGTHLSYWSERPASEAEFLSVTIGSLLGDDLEALDELNLLPEDTPSKALKNHTQALQSVPANASGMTRQIQEGTTGGVPWFEEMISGSRLGRTERTGRGFGRSQDGTMRVEWEVSEFVDDGNGNDEPNIATKRKLEDHGDHEMKT